MISYSCKKLKASCLLLFSMAALLFSSCTDVDDQLGSDLIPENQIMTVGRMESYDAVSTSLYLADSVKSSCIGVLLLGREQDDVYGEVSACFLAQYSANYNYGDSADNDNAPFGIDPVVDSLILSIPIEQAYDGDSTVVQSFNIYLNALSTLHYDSTYYSNANYLDYIDGGEPLASFSFAGLHYDGNELRVDLTDTGLGEQLFDFSDDIYEIDSMFHSRFKGLVFTQADNNAGSVYGINAAAMEMTLHYRNFDKYGNVTDTCYYRYTFDDSSSTYNTSINFVANDYTSSQITEINNNVEQDVVYVQGYGGVTTMLEFKEDFIEQLRSLAGEGTGYSSIVINKADLTVYTVGEHDDANEYAPSRLGLYEDYSELDPIADYNYEYEDYYSYTIAYGGYLEKSLFQYNMDITSYFLNLVNGNSEVDSEVVMGTTYSTQVQFQQIALNGSLSSKPPKLTVVYTLIK